MIRTRKKRKKEGGKNDSVPVLFARYVSLNVMGMIGLSCYILADTYFVSKALGASGLASLNLAISVYSIISATGLMFGIGGPASPYSRHRGRTKRQAAFLPGLR